MALPAHQTKHITTLSYQFVTHTFHLSQLDDGRYNGTALWLGAQCLSVYLAEALPPVSKLNPKQVQAHHLLLSEARSANSIVVELQLSNSETSGN